MFLEEVKVAESRLSSSVASVGGITEKTGPLVDL